LGEKLEDKKEDKLGDKLGDKGDKTSGRRAHLPNTRKQEGRQWETTGRQDLRKADAPSNTGTHVGRQWETKGNKTSGRRTQHPTQAHAWGDNGRRQDLGKADTPSNTGTHAGTMGDNLETRRREVGHTM